MKPVYNYFVQMDIRGEIITTHTWARNDEEAKEFGAENWVKTSIRSIEVKRLSEVHPYDCRHFEDIEEVLEYNELY